MPSLAALRRIYGPAIGKAIGAGHARRIRIKSESEDEVEMEDLVRRRFRPAGAPVPVRRTRGYGRCACDAVSTVGGGGDRVTCADGCLSPGSPGRSRRSSTGAATRSCRPSMRRRMA